MPIVPPELTAAADVIAPLDAPPDAVEAANAESTPVVEESTSRWAPRDDGLVMDKPKPVVKAVAVEEKPQTPEAIRLQRIIAREKAIRDREAKGSTWETEKKAHEDALRAAKTNPVEFLKNAGLSLAEIQEYEINQIAAQEQKPVTPKERLERLEKAREDDLKARKDAELRTQQEAVDSYIADYKGQASALLTAEPDNYELLALEPDAAEIVWATAQAIYQNEDRRVATPKEVMDAVEEKLIELAEKRAGTKKIQARLKPATPSTAARPSAVAQYKRDRTQTISPSGSATATPPKVDESTLSLEERRALSTQRLQEKWGKRTN